MKKLIFATNNQHKLQEINAILGDQYRVLSLTDMNFYEEIPETSPTIEENAVQKARYIYDRTTKNCFADDTGLEVEALDGRPGVFSARYAGENATYQDNVDKLLLEMKEKQNRKACFKTVIALFWDHQLYLFEGKICGQILTKAAGKGGFGYDPVFVPDGYHQTFAEMPTDLKNIISHRAIATQKLISFLQKH
ncbi:MAG: non-canonical purine NTP diphosphatase [Bacteroidales bacterium]|jgi:XTP/dITP diphosphohydrolase|nr:non-canonical purine NTP diphosphatase [Bacteroidales bacterium]HOI31905.1 non-canonical purine NTP diphosphatase [Bacteroidales bacterium]